MPRRASVPEGKALFYRSVDPPAEVARPAQTVAPPVSEETSPAQPSSETLRSVGSAPGADTSQRSLVGRPLGPFLVVSELGRGGMGAVYRAQQPDLAREVALKVLHSWLAGQPGFTGSLLAELRSVARLHHPNIVTIHDVGETDGHHYVVMELLAGRSLDRLIREEGPLAPERALRIALQIAVALDYAHATGILHGDVKPGNVVVGPDDHATLTDFALARLADATIRLTTAGAVLGTPDYMSPEQVEGKPFTSAADRYAFGTLLFELLAGRPPFQADTPVGVMMSHVGKPPPSLSSLRPVLSGALDVVLERALAKDPAARYPTCSDLVLAAAAALGAPALARPGRPTGRRRAAVRALAAGIAVLGIAAAGILAVGALPEAKKGPQETAAATAASALATPTTTVAPKVGVGAAGISVMSTPVVSATTSQPASAESRATALPSVRPSVPPGNSPTATATLPLPTAAPTEEARRSPAQPSPITESQAAPVTVPAIPRGTLILVRLNELGTNGLYSMPLADRSIERLTPPSAKWSWAPALSPDGEWIAFATGMPPRADIAIMRRDGSSRRVIARSGELSLGSPWWMPDGRIAFNGDSNDLSEVYAIPREGGDLIQLTRSSGTIEGTRIPTWPREGGLLAFTGRRGGVFRVFVQPPGGVPREISPAGANSYAPAWAPDGKRIAFSGALADGRAGIFTMAPDGGDVRRVAAPSSGTWACCPTWSFDGRWIVYVSNLGAGASQEHGDAYVVPAETGQPTRLTFDGRTYNWRSAWLP